MPMPASSSGPASLSVVTASACDDGEHPEHAGEHHGQPAVERPAAVARPRKPAPRAGADRRAERPRDDRHARADRAEVLAELQVEREHEHQPDHPGEEHERRDEAGAERALAEQARRDERGDAAALAGALDGDERSSTSTLAADRHERPRGPAGLAALDEGVDEQAGGEGDERGAGEVERRRVVRARLGEEPRPPSSAAMPSGTLTRKIARQSRVGVGEHAADHRAEHGAQADHRAEEAERLLQLVRAGRPGG